MNKIRSKPSQDRYGADMATEDAFNQYAGAVKVMGPVFGVVEKFLGPLGTAVGVDLGSLVAVFNNTGTTSFVALGTSSAVAAPTSPANGIPIPPNSYLIIPMGNNNWIISNVATTFGYLLEDDLQYNPNSGSNN
jgi:hypothetical protein